MLQTIQCKLFNCQDFCFMSTEHKTEESAGNESCKKNNSNKTLKNKCFNYIFFFYEQLTTSSRQSKVNHSILSTLWFFCWFAYYSVMNGNFKNANDIIDYLIQLWTKFNRIKIIFATEFCNIRLLNDRIQVLMASHYLA